MQDEKEAKALNQLEMDEMARQERNRYFREYRAKNPEKVREANRRYWAKRAAKLSAEEGVINHAEDEDD